MPDAVVIGAGPNGLVAANLLADRGWDVLVLEAGDEPGGAVRSGPLTGESGYRHDLFSAFYPLAVASPVMRALELEAHGLRWRLAPLALADPALDGSCAVLSTNVDETAASLDAFAAGDGDAWRDLYALWRRVGDAVLDAAFGAAFPPLKASAKLCVALRRDLPRFVRTLALPVRRLADERFRGAGAARLLAGSALHADLAPESSGGAAFAWLLCALGQQHGWPVPEGGAGELTAALVRRLAARGGHVETRARVREVVVRRGRACGVRLVDRDLDVGARRAVIADVGAPALYRDLLPRGHVPARVLADVDRFEYDWGTVKVDWALDGPVPWTAASARRAGVIHVTHGVDALTTYAGEIARGLVPARPFLIFGQYSTADPTRAPAGAETAWAYTHVPQRPRGDAGGDGLRGVWDDREEELIAGRIEAQVEELAPGFGGLIRARHVFTPPKLERADANLVGGALGGGTAQLHQQGPLRPIPGLGRPATPVRSLYLASASAHPGGGVHGACGANAARAALRARR